VASIGGNGQINIGTSGTGNSTLKANSLLQGSAGPGDSGGPMFAFYGSNFATQANDMTQWKLVGLTATASALGTGNIASWGTNSNYSRVANWAGWVTSTMAAAPLPPATTTGAWVQDSGSGLYDYTGRAKFSVTGSNAAPIVHSTFGAGASHS